MAAGNSLRKWRPYKDQRAVSQGSPICQYLLGHGKRSATNAPSGRKMHTKQPPLFAEDTTLLRTLMWSLLAPGSTSQAVKATGQSSTKSCKKGLGGHSTQIWELEATWLQAHSSVSRNTAAGSGKEELQRPGTRPLAQGPPPPEAHPRPSIRVPPRRALPPGTLTMYVAPPRPIELRERAAQANPR